jgi:hypothetical protein
MSALLDALGFVGDALDRPGAAVRGLLAGRPDQLANLLPGAETFGLLDPSRKVSGQDLLRMGGLIDEGDGWGNALAGMAVDTLTNPLTYAGALGAGRLFGRGPKPAPGGAPAPSTSAGKLLGHRRNFDMVEVSPSFEGTGFSTRPLNADVGRATQRRVGSRMAEAASEGAEGAYFPDLNAGAVMSDARPVARRHEVIHGLIDQATKSGDASGLPLAAKLPVWMTPKAGPDAPFRYTLAKAADELAAQSLENRGLLEQLRGAGRFLFNNPLDPAQQGVRRAYLNQYREFSPGAARLLGAAGNAPLAAGGLAAGGLGLGAAGRAYNAFTEE